MTTPSSRALSSVALTILLVGAAGCGSSGSASTASPDAGHTSSAASPSQSPSQSPSSSGPTASSAAADSGLTSMPTTCPPAATIATAIGASLTNVFPRSMGKALNCTYLHGTSSAGPAVNLTFGSYADGPSGVATWTAAMKKAAPTGTFVGVGDGGFVFATARGASVINFISNGVSCNAYASHFTPDQTHLVAMAKAILAG